jgi:hypothetical protein
MSARLTWPIATLLVVSCTGATASQQSVEEVAKLMRSSDRQHRQALFDLLQPVVLSNCEFVRLGEPNDGGYLMCGNLLDRVEAGYSYGIANYDQWGCDISTRLGVVLHQYDCFDTRQPACSTGQTVFHAECVADTRKTEDGRLFDSMESQFTRNGDANKRLVVKMDVEGAEWDSLLHASDETLDRFDQLAIELHFMNEPRHIEVVKRLKQFFHIAHLHFNNHACAEGIEPFPAWAYEVLFVNKRVGIVDETRRWSGAHPLATPADPRRADCQSVPVP